MTVKAFLPAVSKKDTRLTTAKAVLGPVCSPLTPEAGGKFGAGQGRHGLKSLHENWVLEGRRQPGCAVPSGTQFSRRLQRPMIPPASGREEKFPLRLLTE
jgi:hypothetical protein